MRNRQKEAQTPIRICKNCSNQYSPKKTRTAATSEPPIQDEALSLTSPAHITNSEGQGRRHNQLPANLTASAEKLRRTQGVSLIAQQAATGN
jgi:hypothetical protein